MAGIGESDDSPCVFSPRHWHRIITYKTSKNHALASQAFGSSDFRGAVELAQVLIRLIG